MDAITLPQSLMTLQDLTTLGGLVVAVYIITMFIKEPLKKRWGDSAVRPASLIVALVIMGWLIVVAGTFTAEAIGMAVINAFLVALVAGAAHDYIVAPTKEKAAAKQIAAEQAQLDIMGVGQSAAETAAAVKKGDRGSGDEPPSTTI